MVVKTLLYDTRKCGCKGGCVSARCFLQRPRNGSMVRSPSCNMKLSLGLSQEHLVHVRGLPRTSPLLCRLQSRECEKGSRGEGSGDARSEKQIGVEVTCCLLGATPSVSRHGSVKKIRRTKKNKRILIQYHVDLMWVSTPSYGTVQDLGDLCMYVVLSYIYICTSTYNKYVDKHVYVITETCTCDIVIRIVHFIYLRQQDNINARDKGERYL